MIEVIANVLKFFANKVATCHCSFNVKKGQIKYGERSKLFISVKDPFIKHLNHGHKFTEKDNFQKVIFEFTSLLEESSRGKAFEYMYKEM